SSSALRLVENTQCTCGLLRDGALTPPPVTSMTFLPPANRSMNQCQKRSAAVPCENQLPQCRTGRGLLVAHATSMPTVPTSPGIIACTESALTTSRSSVAPLRRSQNGRASLRRSPRPHGTVSGTTTTLRPASGFSLVRSPDRV